MHRNIDCSDAEWQARQELAACYRIFDMLGWSEWIYNHISLRVPGEDGAFLINPFGLLYSEVCASNLVKINIDENQSTPRKLGVKGIPTLQIFKNGSLEAQKVGAVPKSQLKAFIDSVI